MSQSQGLQLAVIPSSLSSQAYQGDLGLDESLMSDSFYHTLREARIAEVKEELDRVLSQVGKTIQKNHGIFGGKLPSSKRGLLDNPPFMILPAINFDFFREFPMEFDCRRLPYIEE